MEKWRLVWTKLQKLNRQVITSLPTGTAGVYRLSYRDPDDSYYVFYVGKSEDIKSTLLKHLTEEDNNPSITNFINSYECFFRYAKVTREPVRDGALRQMYNHYEPSANSDEPEGPDNIKVNLT